MGDGCRWPPLRESLSRSFRSLRCAFPREPARAEASMGQPRPPTKGVLFLHLRHEQSNFSEAPYLPYWRGEIISSERRGSSPGDGLQSLGTTLRKSADGRVGMPDQQRPQGAKDGGPGSYTHGPMAGNWRASRFLIRHVRHRFFNFSAKMLRAKEDLHMAAAAKPSPCPSAEK
jgi:hypothetical protein